MNRSQPRSVPNRRRGMPRGMTMIELIVAIAILAIALVVGGVAFGAVTGAETHQGANQLSTAVRYAYNLSAINNKTYALFINFNDNTYRVAPVDTSTECDRLLLNLDGGDQDPLIKTYAQSGEKKKKDDDDNAPRGMFDAVKTSGSDTGPPSWANDKSSATGKLRGLTRGVTEPEEPVEVDEKTAKTDDKRLKTVRRNELEKPKKLPKNVTFDGVVLKDGGDPITEGEVPILFFPHGYVQRALIYVKGGDGPNAELMTVEIMTLQGTGKVHGEALDSSAFREQVD